MKMEENNQEYKKIPNIHRYHCSSHTTLYELIQIYWKNGHHTQLKIFGNGDIFNANLHHFQAAAIRFSSHIQDRMRQQVEEHLLTLSLRLWASLGTLPT